MTPTSVGPSHSFITIRNPVFLFHISCEAPQYETEPKSNKNNVGLLKTDF